MFITCFTFKSFKTEKNWTGQNEVGSIVSPCVSCVSDGKAYCTSNVDIEGYTMGQCGVKDEDSFGIGITYGEGCSSSGGSLIEVKEQCPGYVSETSEIGARSKGALLEPNSPEANNAIANDLVNSAVDTFGVPIENIQIQNIYDLNDAASGRQDGIAVDMKIDTNNDGIFETGIGLFSPPAPSDVHGFLNDYKYVDYFYQRGLEEPVGEDDAVTVNCGALCRALSSCQDLPAAGCKCQMAVSGVWQGHCQSV